MRLRDTQFSGFPSIKTNSGSVVKMATNYAIRWLTVLLAAIRCIDGVNYQQVLLEDLFKNYDKDANPEPPGDNSTDQTATVVTFAAKPVRLIELNERANTIQTQWWIQQRWTNKDLSWNKSKYGNVETIFVSPKRVWTPDILLYNSVRLFDSAEDDDRLSGGTDKYKTQIRISSDGDHYWLAPAMFKSICDINTRYFPFDDQYCFLYFGSWAFDHTKLDMKIDENETVVTRYKSNTEWELLAFKAQRDLIDYSCCKYPYTRVSLNVSLRRRYYYYMVNLVVPCSLIAVMVLLSFVLPPEAGERISLGITVLMAMAIFQELTSGKLPVESTHTPLLAQYYSSAIAEIGLAILATSIILNFHYRKVKMPNYLRRLIFSFLGPLVGIKRNKNSQTPNKLLRRSLKKANGKSNDNDHFIRGNCELKSLGLLHNDSVSQDCESGNDNHNSIRETQINDDSDTAEQDNYQRQDEKDLIDCYAKDWQEAARILDRFVFVFAIFLCVCTFGGVFIQAPRVQNKLFGEEEMTLEQSGLGGPVENITHT